MNLQERLEALAAADFAGAWAGTPTAEDWLAYVRAELGHESALEGFITLAGRMTRALAPDPLLHIVSGNTPHAAVQSVARGLALGSRNLVKLPGAGLPDFSAFVASLPPVLRQRVEISRTLPNAWQDAAEALVVIGSDETIAEFQRRRQPEQRLFAFGHKFSIGIVHGDWTDVTARHAAEDICRDDQLGCLALQTVFVERDAPGFAKAVAASMRGGQMPEPGSAATVMARRHEDLLAEALGEPVQVWRSGEALDWTVVFDGRTQWQGSPGYRYGIIRPMELLYPMPIPHLSTIGLWPCDLAHANRWLCLGATRYAPLGQMQHPPLAWHQDGFPALGQLVRWIDFEPENAPAV